MKNAFDKTDIFNAQECVDIFRKKYPMLADTHKSIDDLLNSGLKALSIYFPGAAPSNVTDTYTTPKVYVGYPTLRTETQTLEYWYIGRSGDAMFSRNQHRPREWNIKKQEKRFHDAINENDKRVTFKMLCFEQNGNKEADTELIVCLEKCLFEFYQILGKSDYLFNEQKGSKNLALSEATKKIQNISDRFLISLVIWCMLMGLNARPINEDRTNRNEKPYKCDVCGNRYTKKSNLTNHTRAKHAYKEVYDCDHCDNEQFETKDGLIIHLFNVHADEKSARCLICEKKFNIRGPAQMKMVLKQHLDMVHLKEKPHECVICKKGFAMKSDLKRHVKNVHKGERPFECSDCKDRFKLKYSLNQHMKNVHGGSKERFECDTCGSRFKQRCNLNQHIRRYHTEEERFECDICGKHFSAKSSITDHLNTVLAGKKRFKCMICNKLFKEKRQLMKHLNNKVCSPN